MADLVGYIRAFKNRVRSWATRCADISGDEELKRVLERSQQVLSAAEFTAELSSRLRNDPGVFMRAREGLSQISNTLETANNAREKANTLCLDALALIQIGDAIQALNEPGAIQRDPEAAAEAFGNLFTGFGRLARRLPVPAKGYAEILEGCGGSFFNTMRKKLNFEEVYKSRGISLDVSDE